MRRAFNPREGALHDPEAEGGELQATADLFAGAIGAYKNPASHRSVKFDDPMESAEVIQLTDLRSAGVIPLQASSIARQIPRLRIGEQI